MKAGAIFGPMSDTNRGERPPRRLRFGVFELDTADETLYHRGREVAVQEMPLKLLAVLLERPGELVRREELFRRLWPNDRLGILDDNLNVAISKLRQALHDTADHPRYVETVPRKGYRFVAPVEVVDRGTGKPAGQDVGTGTGTGTGAQARRSSWNLVARVGATLAVLLVLAGLLLWRTAPEVQPPIEIPEVDTYSVAVLPFANLSGDPDNEFFADGITEDLITYLSRAPDFRVISRSSVMRYKGSDKSIPEIAAELRVTHLLEGSVRRADNRVRITAQLVDGRTDHHLWAEHYDRSLEDIFAIQSEIASAITDELQAALPGNGADPPVDPTDDVEAYRLYLHGRYLFNNYYELAGDDSVLRAIEYYQRALERDAEFAQAWAALGSAYALAMGQPGLSNELEDAAGKAEAAVARALELDPSNAEAPAALAVVEMLQFRWADAERSLLRSIEADPELSLSYVRYGILLVSVGKSREARDVLQRALELDPVNAIASHWLADAWRNAGRLEESLEHAQRTVDLAPTGGSGIGVYLYHLLRGEWERAISRQEFFSRERGIDPEWVRPIVAAVRDPGRTAEAVEAATAVAEAYPAFEPVFYYFDLQAPDLVFDGVERMLERGDGLIAFWRFWEPQLTHLRNHPRFRELAVRAGLLAYWREMGWPDLCTSSDGRFVCE